jgi:hypothetical protein
VLGSLRCWGFEVLRFEVGEFKELGISRSWGSWGIEEFGVGVLGIRGVGQFKVLWNYG